MAIIKRGILGGFSKSIGNIVGTSWKGIAIMKSKPLSVANPRTAGQVTQRNAFKACTQFASLILASMLIPLMNRFSVQMSGFNMFVKLNTLFFDYTGIFAPEDITFGSGKLGDTPVTSEIIDVSDDTAIISWNTALDNSFKLDTDIPYVLLVDSVTQEIIQQGIAPDAATRISGSTTVPMQGLTVLGRTYWTYLIFLRADGTIVGNTAYRDTVAQA